MLTRLALTVLALASAGAVAVAQSAPAVSSSSTRAIAAGEDIDGASMADPTPQYGGGGGRGGYKPYGESRFSHLAIEAGGGFTAPIGNNVSGGFTNSLNYLGFPGNYGTTSWGGNILAGAGWKFTKRLTLLGEYQFNTNKIPGRTLSAEYDTDAIDFSNEGIDRIGGNVHTQSVTAEPVFYYYDSDRHKYSGYLIGGVGWYHKTINFTAPVLQEDYFGDVFTTNQTFSSYGDNGIGFNLGTGVAFKVFGPDSPAKLFAEARYTFVNTPSQSAADNANPNSFILHTGTEELIPVTVGVRF